MNTRISKPLIIMLVFFFLFSCNNNEPTQNIKTDTLTTKNEVDIETEKPVVKKETKLSEFISLFDKIQNKIYLVDSNFIINAEDVNEQKRLTGKQVKILSSNFINQELTQYSEYYLESFYKIDSLKNENAYQKYVEELDIDMMKCSDAYALNNFKLNDNKTEILTWYIKYSTYEACPYMSGISIFLTTLVDGKITNGALLGEIMSSGDPPISMIKNIYGEIENNGILNMKYSEITTEEDGSEILSDTISKFINFTITDGLINIKK